MNSDKRNLIAGLLLTATAISPSCTSSRNPTSTPTLTSPNIPTNQPFTEESKTVVPHDTSKVAQAISVHGDHLIDSNNEVGEIMLEGGQGNECIATVIVGKVRTPNGKEKILLSPGVATALDDIDADTMNLSVHLDVDTGTKISSPSIPAESITNNQVVREAASDLLKTAKIGCEIWARDIAPKQ